MSIPTTFFLLNLIILCDGRISWKVFALTGSQVLQRGSPLTPTFCPLLPPVSPPPQLPETGPIAAPAPTNTGKKSPSLPPPPPQQQERKGAPVYAVWCLAKPTVPQAVMQEAMDYACGWGADCKAIQVNGPCYQPNTLLSHASFAFNSYFQKKKKSGGTCDFGGTAMLVTVDPSFNGCHFSFI